VFVTASRRGIRAAFMLIPLFGLQMILTVYRPRSSNQTAEELHEFVFLLTAGSQVTVFGASRQPSFASESFKPGFHYPS